jgi:hypothetical protein
MLRTGSNKEQQSEENKVKEMSHGNAPLSSDFLPVNPDEKDIKPWRSLHDWCQGSPDIRYPPGSKLGRTLPGNRLRAKQKMQI